MLAGDERQGQSQLNLLKAQPMRHVASCCVGNAENSKKNNVCLWCCFLTRSSFASPSSGFTSNPQVQSKANDSQFASLFKKFLGLIDSLMSGTLQPCLLSLSYVWQSDADRIACRRNDLIRPSSKASYNILGLPLKHVDQLSLNEFPRLTDYMTHHIKQNSKLPAHLHTHTRLVAYAQVFSAFFCSQIWHPMAQSERCIPNGRSFFGGPGCNKTM